MRFYYILLILFINIELSLVIFKSSPNYRLRNDVKPYKYDILLQPYLLSVDGDKQFTFDAEVNITFRCTNDKITSFSLHLKDIQIKNMLLYDDHQNWYQNFKTKEMLYYKETDQLLMKLQKSLIMDRNYLLYIKYRGNIRNDSYGLFRFSYDSGKSWQVLTALQPLGARLMLPCFDEPTFKAQYRLRVIRPLNYKSYFNSRILGTTKIGDNLEMDTFDFTPLMSSYLLAFMLTNFISYGNNDIKMIMPKDKINETLFAYKVTENVLQFYDAYFHRSYQKLGNSLMQITFAKKYKYLALENWGLLVFRDSLISQISNKSYGMSVEYKCIRTIIHEITHMWFGNSVTFKWWNHIWLNEAFARYYEIIVGDFLYAEYKFEQRFIIEKLHLVFDMDAKFDIEPMTSKEDNINTAKEINSKFNSITYDKGAAILRMFSSAMGRDNFHLAIRDYLKENHLKNTQPEDLFRYLTKYWPLNQRVNLTQFFQDWSEQPGFPILTITTNDHGEFVLKQKRCISNRDSKYISLTYTIPITYTTDQQKDFENLTPKFYFNKTLEHITFGNIRNQKWLLLNLQQTSYVRVFYSSILLKQLNKAFKASNHSGIPVINRAAIIDDLFTFAYMDLIDYRKVFDFLQYLTKETQYLPWRATFKGFDIINKKLKDIECKKFEKFLYRNFDVHKVEFENVY